MERMQMLEEDSNFYLAKALSFEKAVVSRLSYNFRRFPASRKWKKLGNCYTYETLVVRNDANVKLVRLG